MMRLPSSLGAVGSSPRAHSRLATPASASGNASGPSDIYIGFPKGDYARPPGRKGRVIQDDPSKYPGKEDLLGGNLLGAVGGWPGGEAGLKKFIAENAPKKEEKGVYPSSPLRPPQKNVSRPIKGVGKDPIYVGFSKDELELRKSGAQGRVIFDEAYKYPGKEDLGGFLGAVGGFAGGERALKEFVETGELKLRRPGEPVPRQVSPVQIAFLLSLSGAGAALLFTAVREKLLS